MVSGSLALRFVIKFRRFDKLPLVDLDTAEACPLLLFASGVGKSVLPVDIDVDLSVLLVVDTFEFRLLLFLDWYRFSFALLFDGSLLELAAVDSVEIFSTDVITLDDALRVLVLNSKPLGTVTFFGCTRGTPNSPRDVKTFLGAGFALNCFFISSSSFACLDWKEETRVDAEVP